MKNLSRTLGILIIALFSTSAFSQEITGTGNPEINNYDQGFRFGIGVSAGMPTDNNYDFALGADARLQYDLTQKSSLTLTSGYTHLFLDNGGEDLGFIPVKAGFKYFVGESVYLAGEAGAGIPVTNDYTKTTFLWSPSIGWANDVIDISARYEGMNDFGTDQVALRIAYGFKL